MFDLYKILQIHISTSFSFLIHPVIVQNSLDPKNIKKIWYVFRVLVKEEDTNIETALAAQHIQKDERRNQAKQSSTR